MDRVIGLGHDGSYMRDLDRTLHLYRDVPDRARHRIHVRSTHFAEDGIGDDLWTCWGDYDYAQGSPSTRGRRHAHRERLVRASCHQRPCVVELSHSKEVEQ